ncbi:MAG TPA: HlyD family type I secretion periplasmic adaptor subunit [Amaricoccus sp.]|jgi:HlyD family secretion protein|nr:HlyD family type I secretion periplasmic adaptor subunit [Amaricoccus sp.]
MTAIADVGLPSYRAPFLVAVVVIASLTLSFGGWAMYARLDSAVVSQGVLLAESQRKTVENLEGGILRRLLVDRGDHVTAGQVVAQLDATQTEEQLAQIEANRLGLAYDIWRLEAEAAGAALDPALAPSAPADQRAGLTAAQQRLFEARQRALHGQVTSLNRQIGQLEAQRAASLAQATAASRQLDSWSEERALNARLVESGATPRQKLFEIDRTIALLDGERDENLGLAAAAQEEIARARADIETLGQQRLAEVGEQLSLARRELGALAAQARGAEDVLERRNLRAPQAGTIVDIRIVTPGAVVPTGAPLMDIVPDADRLIASIRIPLDAIDTVHVGRKARVKLTAYHRAKGPVVEGEVIYVSADLIEDERDGSAFFEARVALDPATLARLPGVTLTAGMPVEVAIRTGERRAGDYFLEPLTRSFGRALREE